MSKHTPLALSEKEWQEIGARMGWTTAAAPELLAAAELCERLLLSSGDPFNGDDWQAMQTVRAAIDKARGV